MPIALPAALLLAAALHAQPAEPAIKPLPGTALGLSRANREAPPRIPHGAGDCLPFTRGSNPCVDCHDTGARGVCTACHVATTDAGPRVGNTARR